MTNFPRYHKKQGKAHWSFGMDTPSADQSSWFYWVRFGESFKSPIFEIRPPTFEMADFIGRACMDRDRVLGQK